MLSMYMQVFSKEKAQQRKKDVRVRLRLFSPCNSHVAARCWPYPHHVTSPQHSCTACTSKQAACPVQPSDHAYRSDHSQEEMKRGYFDDFKDLKETQGRMFEPSEALSFASTSPQLPTIAVRPAPHLLF